MRRAWLLALALACHKKEAIEVAGPTVRITATWPGASAADVDKMIVAPIEAAMGSGAHTRGRAHGDTATIEVAGLDAEAVGAALARIGPQLPPGVGPETGIVDRDVTTRYAIAPGPMSDDRVALDLERVIGVRRVDVCGQRHDEMTVDLDMERTRAYGLDPLAVIDAVGGAEVDASDANALGAIAVGSVKLRDVATIARSPAPSCLAVTSRGNGVAIEIDERGAEVDKLAAALAGGSGELLDAPIVQTTRVALGDRSMARAQQLAAAAMTDMRPAAWVIVEIEPGEPTATLIVGSDKPIPDVVARACARHELEVVSLGGAVELAAAVSRESAPAHVAALTARGLAAGCDGCAGGRSELTADIDRNAAADHGAPAAAVARAVQLAMDDGIELPAGVRVRLASSADPVERFGQVSVRTASGGFVPLDAVVQLRKVPVDGDYLRDDGTSFAAVWVREASEDAARAALDSVVPPGTPIRKRD